MLNDVTEQVLALDGAEQVEGGGGGGGGGSSVGGSEPAGAAGGAASNMRSGVEAGAVEEQEGKKARADSSGGGGGGGGAGAGKLVDAEQKVTGAVGLGTYTTYMRLAGAFMCACVLLFAAGLNAQQIIVNWWLSRWSVASTDGGGSSSRPLEYWLGVYFGLGLGAVLLIFLFQILAACAGLTAAARIHARMFTALLGAPLSFYDTTLSGRLLNLFTADMKAIDDQLIEQLSGALSLLFMMISVLAVVVAGIPLSMAPLLPLFVLYGE
eukprot:COSAG01_NODE_2374_length_7803_cov_5.861241_5_plen_267_part_00